MFLTRLILVAAQWGIVKETEFSECIARASEIGIRKQETMSPPITPEGADTLLLNLAAGLLTYLTYWIKNKPSHRQRDSG